MGTLDSDFGVYIKTYWKDYHLARSAIRSLRQQLPNVDITLIPDDSYSKSTLLGEKVLQVSDKRMSCWRGFYKKLWCFYGPYKRFLYLDADVMAIRPLENLIGRFESVEPGAVLVNGQSKFLDLDRTKEMERWKSVCAMHLGDLGLIARFDPELDLTNYYPFNTGLMFSYREPVPIETTLGWFTRAQKLQSESGYPPLGHTRKGVFMSDQGFINYFLRKAGIRVDLLRDIYVWGSEALCEKQILSENDPLKWCFVHWAGSNLPSLWSRSMLFHRDWKENYVAHVRQQKGLAGLAWDVTKSVGVEVARKGRREFARVSGRTLDRDAYGKRING